MESRLQKRYGGFLSRVLQINLYLFPHSLKYTSVVAYHERFHTRLDSPFERLSLAGDGSHSAIHLTRHTRPFSHYFSSLVDGPNILSMDAGPYPRRLVSQGKPNVCSLEIQALSTRSKCTIQL